MSKKKEPNRDIIDSQDQQQQAPPQGQAEPTQQPENPPDPVPEQPDPVAQLEQTIAQQEDRFLRLAAEYDNYRRRTAKEKQAAWLEVRGETAAAFFPVYDNLERALKQQTPDEAYKKGIEMTMTQLKEVFAQLDITEIPALGEPFDPNLHNAVMHAQHEGLESNTISEVFQAGFRCGERVLRHAMVAVVQ